MKTTLMLSLLLFCAPAAKAESLYLTGVRLIIQGGLLDRNEIQSNLKVYSDRLQKIEKIAHTRKPGDFEAQKEIRRQILALQKSYSDQVSDTPSFILAWLPTSHIQQTLQLMNANQNSGRYPDLANVAFQARKQIQLIQGAL